MQRRAAVVGVGESAYYKRGASPDPEFVLACTAIRRAVEDAGLPLAEVDGLVSFMDTRNDPLRVSTALGFRELRFSAQPWGGGGNGMAAAVALADAAVTAGYARHVVVFRALAQGEFGRFGRAATGSRIPGAAAYTATYGLLSPAQICAMQTVRFMHEHGIDQEALAEIALACYAHAQSNPRAIRHGTPLTREQYHASRWIVEPFHLFDCCPENDGSAAVVLTSFERARDLRRKPVPVLAAAQGLGHRGGTAAFNEPGFPTAHYKEVGRQIWERSGVNPEDVDVAQFYENFTGPVLMAMSEMGFAPPDGIAEFVADGALQGPDARLCFNTSGGNLAEAYIHGLELVNEAVRQVRGESTMQASKVDLSLCVAGPGFAPGSAVLFSAP
ncbi:MAG: acetyl-CoA acetyltransferase [Acidimicrobiia bacterium]|nr:acetyl-CoA acetyltransferase [Acidimicrobiia bacterium]